MFGKSISVKPGSAWALRHLVNGHEGGSEDGTVLDNDSGMVSGSDISDRKDTNEESVMEVGNDDTTDNTGDNDVDVILDREDIADVNKSNGSKRKR